MTTMTHPLTRTTQRRILSAVEERVGRLTKEQQRNVRIANKVAKRNAELMRRLA